MARKPTTFSKVSTGYNDSANSVLESGYDLGFIDGYGTNLTLGDGLTVTGDLSVTGDVVVADGTTIGGFSLTTHTIDFGSLGVSGGQSTVTVGIASALKDDGFFISVPSIWSVADYQVDVKVSSGSTTGEVNVTALNSGLTTVDPTSGTFTILRVGF